MWNKLKRIFHIHEWKYEGSDWHGASFWTYKEKCDCGEIRERCHMKSQSEILADISRKLSKNKY